MTVKGLFLLILQWLRRGGARGEDSDIGFDREQEQGDDEPQHATPPTLAGPARDAVDGDPRSGGALLVHG